MPNSMNPACDAVKPQLHGNPGGGALASLEPRLPAIQRAYTAEPSAESTPSGDCIITKADWRACMINLCCADTRPMLRNTL